MKAAHLSLSRKANVPPTATQMDDFPDTFIDDSVERAADEAMWDVIGEDFLVSPEQQLTDEEFADHLESL